MGKLELLEEILGRFESPFLPDGFVTTSKIDCYKEPALSIHIGDRNVTVLENGEVVGQGRHTGRQWRVERDQGWAAKTLECQ